MQKMTTCPETRNHVVWEYFHMKEEVSWSEGEVLECMDVYKDGPQGKDTHMRTLKSTCGWWNPSGL